MTEHEAVQQYLKDNNKSAFTRNIGSNTDSAGSWKGLGVLRDYILDVCQK